MKKSVLFLMMFCLISSAFTLGQSPTEEPLILPARPLGQGQVKTRLHPVTGMVRFLGCAGGQAIAQPPGLRVNTTPEVRARHFLSAYGHLFGLTGETGELALKRSKTLANGRGVVRFQQYAHGLPVLAGQLVVNMDAAGNVLSVNGEILPDLEGFDVTETISEEEALKTALDSVSQEYKVSGKQLQVTPHGKWIFHPGLTGGPGPGLAGLTWYFEIFAPREPVRALVLVDAHLGGVSLSFNQINDAMDRKTFDCLNTTTLPGSPVCADPTACGSTDPHVLSAHYYAKTTYDFYASYHGRDSIDDMGLTLLSYTHYNVGLNNAYWDGVEMIYGDASGFPLAEDVVAHELSHGVTQYESGLFYYYQSGAINESFSDLWGEFVDQTNTITTAPYTDNDATSVRWLMGEDVAGLGAIRDMSNPPAYSQPDKMSSSFYYCGSGDNGGVHYNSGINNKAVYLLTDGGTFNGYTITGLGLTTTAELYYEVQTNLLVSGSDYADLCDALLQACVNLGFTVAQTQDVQDTLDAVEMCDQPSGCPASDVDYCSSGIPINLFFDDIESGSGNWATGTGSGGVYWYIPQTTAPYAGYNVPYATSGVGNVWGLDQGVSSDMWMAMNADVVIPANAWLHFSHSHGFSFSGSNSFAGGVVEYSTNGGSTWTDAGSLISNNGYNGTINSTSNPLNGRPAFVRAKGYYETRLNLSSLASSSVRFRFRIGARNDPGMNAYLGWFIDDVRLYTCGTALSDCDQIQTIQSNGSGNWNSASTWNPVRVPNSNDIVKVNAGHVVTFNSSSTVNLKGLCNDGYIYGATNVNIKINTSEFMHNNNRIWAADGADGYGSNAATWVSGKPGKSVTLTSPIFRNGLDGDIQAGRGGNDISFNFFDNETLTVYGAQGGNVYISGDDLINEGQIGPDDTPTDMNPSANSDGGNGGIADNFYGVWMFEHGNSGPAYGGDGGYTIFFGTTRVENTCDGRICSGNGGYANAGQNGQTAIPGDGGNLIFTAPTAIQDGILTAGGTGAIYYEPYLLALDQCARLFAAADVTIFGGRDWEMVISPDVRERTPIEATNSITVAMGEGATLDMRGVREPIFSAREVTIYSDNILLDEGVSLDQLIQAERITVEGARILFDVHVLVSPFIAGEPGEELVIPIEIMNNGPTEDLYKLEVTDEAGWRLDGLPTEMSVAGLHCKTYGLVVSLPDLAGISDRITVTARSLSNPEVTSTYEFTLSINRSEEGGAGKPKMQQTP